MVPIVLGTFFSIDIPIMDADWAATQQQVEDQTQWLIPITMMSALFVFILKVLMVASVRGRD